MIVARSEGKAKISFTQHHGEGSDKLTSWLCLFQKEENLNFKGDLKIDC